MDIEVLDLDNPDFPSYDLQKALSFEGLSCDTKKDEQSLEPPPPSDEGDETEDVRKEVFLPYEHVDWIPGCVRHPGNIVEPATLAIISSKVDDSADVAQSLPQSAILEGKLSSLQLESVIKASLRHRVILPSGERAGFFIGDAAGVGKGRQIAGVMLDNFSRGRTKHIWFSVSTDLIIDARRDLEDIGCYINVIDGCKAIDKGTKLFGLLESVRSGVVFSTYSTLVSHIHTGRLGNLTTRLEQLINWCGGSEFDGCLVFDECHKAKNFVPGNENASSKVSLAVCAIQKALPKARVMYCSATGVTDVKNMAFMERMGLWGESSAFKSYEAFLDTITKKGLGIAEMLAMDMKRDGLYVSRMLSFSDARFYNLDCNLTPKQKLMYNMAAHIWNEVRKSLAVAISRCRCSRSRSKLFWSQHQRFFQQMCISLKVDMVVAEAQGALADNKCVVIGIQNTGEANMEGRISKGGYTTGFISSCRETLLNFIDNHFPVEIEYQMQPGAALDPNIRNYDDWSLRARSMLTQYANQLELPDSALDALVDKLGGPSKVAEMTGRKGRIVRKDPQSKPQYELRQSGWGCPSDQSLNVTERNNFMKGKKLIAIISDAASTGISLHADRNCLNQRQRVHITLQLPWSADKAVQQLGRSHRSNQASGPIYKLITTELGGERRFAASVAKRLESLGALTKGDRRAATGADLSMFNYDTMYGRTALKLLYQSIVKGEIPKTISPDKLTCGYMSAEKFIAHMKECLVTMGLLTENELIRGLGVSEADSRDVGRFLNRILGLQVSLQNLIFNFFVSCLDVVVTIAKKEGKFNEGFVDLTGNSMTRQGEPKSVFTSLCDGCRQVRLMVDRGMSWADAMKRFEALRGEDKRAGFYKSRNAMHSTYFYMLITPHTSTHYKIARPNTGITVQEIDEEELEHKYEMISIERAELEWNRMYESSLTRCNHGSGCNNPKYCTVGMRRYNLNLVCGSLMRILPLLETTMLKHGLRLQLNKYDTMVKVVRVCLDDGERLIGFQYPEILMGFAEREAKTLALENKTTLFSYFANVSEPIVPVVPRLIRRATIPPPTIKTYFSVIKKYPTDGTEAKEEVAKVEGEGSAPKLEPADQKSANSVKVEAKYTKLKTEDLKPLKDLNENVDEEDDDDIICILDTTPARSTKRKQPVKRGKGRARAKKSKR